MHTYGRSRGIPNGFSRSEVRTNMIDERIIGIWRLRGTKAVDDDGKVLELPYGPTPNGLVCF